MSGTVEPIRLSAKGRQVMEWLCRMVNDIWSGDRGQSRMHSGAAAQKLLREVPGFLIRSVQCRPRHSEMGSG
jgi:hypothetical protein